MIRKRALKIKSSLNKDWKKKYYLKKRFFGLTWDWTQDLIKYCDRQLKRIVARNEQINNDIKSESK